MPEKYSRAFAKAWKGLSRKERGVLEDRLLVGGVSASAISGAIAGLVFEPAVFLPFSPVILGAAGVLIGGLISEGRGEGKRIAKKFSKLFKRHHGKTLKTESKKLEKIKAHQKLRKVM